MPAFDFIPWTRKQENLFILDVFCNSGIHYAIDGNTEVKPLRHSATCV